MTNISEKLVMQRIRNRIIEVLDMFADDESVSKIGSDEIIEFWYDFVDEEKFSGFNKPVFSESEITSIRRFHNLLEKTYSNVPSSFSLESLMSNKYWCRLKELANNETEVFLKRGRFSEDEEIT